MTITARYPGRCGGCGKAIGAGEPVEWTKGSPARHPGCTSRTAAARPRTAAPRRPSFPSSPPEPGAHQVSRRSTGRDDRYTVGQTTHMSRVSIPGGGPDGHYYTVIVEGWSPTCEDNQQFTAQAHAWVRAATDDEAAPVAGRIAAKAQAVALGAELVTLVQAGTRVPEAEAECPEGREVVMKAGAQGSGREVCRLTADGAVALWWSGHYDDYRRSLWLTQDPRAVEIMGVLLGGAQ